MFLATVLKDYPDEMECDLAETYHIQDYRQLPLSRVAVFVYGLGENSRVRSMMSGRKCGFDTFLLAHAVDSLSHLVWFKTKDGEKGKNRPFTISDKLLVQEEKRSEIQGFNSGEEFLNELKRLRGE